MRSQTIPYTLLRAYRGDMTVHIVVTEAMPVGCEETFDLVHDYHRRLEWDTLLRSAYTEGDVPAGKDVVAVCTARRLLGGYSFRTEYAAFNRPKVAAVKLVGNPPFFALWGASIRHEPLAGGRSTATYTMTFRCRPSWAAGILEPIARAMFRYETRKRLKALARALGSGMRGAKSSLQEGRDQAFPTLRR